MARLRTSAHVLVWLVACSTWSISAAHAQIVDGYVSSSAGDRLSRKPRVRFGTAHADAAHFKIDDTVQYQQIIGFGASFLEAGLITLNSLPPLRQEEVLRSLFDPQTGAGFSAMKTVIGGNDFMSAGPFYTYDDTPGDVELKHFSIGRDLSPDGLVTYIKRAQRYGTFALQAPMDYPPDWMLIDADNNQDVNPKYYDALAQYYVRYIQEYAKHGIAINYLSPFNEPGFYTKITYSEIRDLIKDHIGPLFALAGVTAKLQVSDAPLRAFAFHFLPIILDDPATRTYISSISYHGYDFKFKKPTANFAPADLDLLDHVPTQTNGYDFQEFKSVSELHEKYVDLPLWMTEVCYVDMDPDSESWERPLPRYGFDDGEFWGQQIAADVEAGASGWTYWNMILDQNGGPWLVSPQHLDPKYNAQHPVVIINRETKKVTYTGLYYYLAHFSKFVRPGAYRIKTTGSKDKVKLLSFKRPDGVIVTEAINRQVANTRITLDWHDRTVDVSLPAKSISTFLWNGTDGGAARTSKAPDSDRVMTGAPDADIAHLDSGHPQ